MMMMKMMIIGVGEGNFQGVVMGVVLDMMRIKR